MCPAQRRLEWRNNPFLGGLFGSEFTYNPRLWPRHELHKDFLNLSRCFNAQTSTVRVPDLDPKYNISILASKQVGYLLNPNNNNSGCHSPISI
jgi:hypothetical protein